MSQALGVQLTELCGPGCLLCAGAGRSVHARSMPPDTFERVLLEARAVGLRRIVLTGGEPLVHEDLNLIIEHIEKMDVEVEIVSTGHRLDSREPALKRLGKRLVRLTSEFLGGTASTHERTNGRPGSFQEARAVLEVATELGVARRARLIPTAEALRELDGFRAAVSRFAPELVVDRCSSHLPRSATELRSSPEKCGDATDELLAAVSPSGRLYPCLPSIGAQALAEQDAPLLDVRLREALSSLAATDGRRCGACKESFSRRIASLR